ncbi:HAD-IIIA family hydrolase [Cellulomonas sp. ATA003]|uniref:HAD-IIIA family hydrolase n=1 Tax=Cellulomonas sp. ATA003 TaxID=3073064 RepID=UPI002872B2BC|nr:HAD-IIIA family hydrolase [Cellulomonas sp. ATA003]WNB86241.1 HAD-IIIA family hydrolase [Cellulomonas sp. ATA003]
MTPEPVYAVVLPSIGRPSLGVTLRSLAAQVTDADVPGPVEVVVADDRPLTATEALDPAEIVPDAPWPVRVVRTGGRGPAAARNAGWRSVRAPWVAFLDDDVVVPDGWAKGLVADLRAAAPTVGGVQGRIEVPLPAHRRPTDWERNTAGLEGALWATADMAYRRDALVAVHGFDERFPRAYREDADLALRVRRAGWELVRGTRTITHPVRPADDRVSVRVQAGTADDALMRALHGAAWRDVAETGRGRFRWHVATVAGAAAAVVGTLTGRRRVATCGALLWSALTVDFARRRIAPGPRPGEDGWAAEWRRMAWTSAVIPVVAVRHRLRGALAHRGGAPAWPPPLRAVLFDRDGTLVHDVPYNGDPALVRTVDGAREALDAVRAAGLRTGLVTNQSGIGRGLLTRADAEAVHNRLSAELGPLDTVQLCPHTDDDGCACRKPGPGMVLAAAAALGVAPSECAVVGDIGADVGAAVAAGARAVLVPTAQTRPEEVVDAEATAPDLAGALRLLGVPVPAGAAVGLSGTAR